MKPGDIFKDGNRTLKVIDMDSEGRPISTVISYGDVKEEAVTPTEEAPTPKRRPRKVESV